MKVKTKLKQPEVDFIYSLFTINLIGIIATILAGDYRILIPLILFDIVLLLGISLIKYLLK